ncbi:MAG: serine protease [Sandaracinaceae bacterium]
MKRKAIWVAALLALVTACDAAPPAEPARAPVVYGEQDDRREYYEASEADQRLTRESIVALISPTALDFADPSDVGLNAYSLQEAYGLCDDQRFLEQPSAAGCSGTLIDDDLILTAGHCFDEEDPQASCRSQRFVFNYHYTTPGELATIDAGRDVYSCRQVLVRRDDDVDGLRRDYAIIQLDRPVSGAHVPAPIAPGSDPAVPGDTFSVIGFGSGLPAKIDTSGEVILSFDGPLDFFTGSIDTFGGNSGSGVFNDSGRVIGILVRGATDYIDRGDCKVVNEIEAEPDRGGESISYVATAVTALCDTEWPSLRVCGTERSCGDGMCTGIETADNCSEDCDAATCNDGVCDATEDEVSCPEDCFVAEDVVPAE